MPFTLSHAAAALPFRRTRLVMSAVVVGCFAPDFVYFLEFGPHSRFGHTLAGLFVLDLPLAFIVLWLFHRYAKQPLAALLPSRARRRLDLDPRTLTIGSFSQLALVGLSIVVGATTHLIWDSFTHEHSWVAVHWSFLRREEQLPLFGLRPWCDILQYISSVLGIVVILIWCVYWYRNTSPVRSQPDRDRVKTDRIAMACALVVAIVIALLRAAASGLPNGVHGVQRFLSNAVVTAVFLFWFEVVLYGMIRAASRHVDESSTARNLP
jgi:Domain of unknown function (DUF4184)